MDTLAQLGDGFAQAPSLSNLVFAGLGVLIGTAVGVLPGIGPALTVALLPITFRLDPGGSLSTSAGIYYGGGRMGARPRRSCSTRRARRPRS